MAHTGLKGLATNDATALLGNPDGQAKVVGDTAVYFTELAGVTQFAAGMAFEGKAKVRMVATGKTFSYSMGWNWGDTSVGEVYTVTAQYGTLTSTQTGTDYFDGVYGFTRQRLGVDD